jgi:thiol peroxidase
MSERKEAVTFQSKPLTLVGNEVKEGDQAPDFTVVDTDLNDKTLNDYKGKVLLITSVPSLDTSVCEQETKRFNMEVGLLGSQVQALVISMDLPFAQARWVERTGVKTVKTLSDHREASFGQNWGVLIKELRLLSRVVFVVDKSGRITYREVVEEITFEPQYDAAISAVREHID